MWLLLRTPSNILLIDLWLPVSSLTPNYLAKSCQGDLLKYVFTCPVPTIFLLISRFSRQIQPRFQYSQNLLLFGWCQARYTHTSYIGNFSPCLFIWNVIQQPMVTITLVVMVQWIAFFFIIVTTDIINIIILIIVVLSPLPLYSSWPGIVSVDSHYNHVMLGSYQWRSSETWRS